MNAAGMQLPIEYAEALELARAMLSAAREGRWDEVADRRRRIPQLAGSLARRWEALRQQDPALARQLEPARIAAIREVIAVDDRIRRLADPRLAAVGDLLQTGRGNLPASGHSSRSRQAA